MKFFHLSHTDLDGYGAQFVSKFYIKDGVYLNSNYGKEINEKFMRIISSLGDEESVILISDLNLTIAQCEEFDRLVRDKNAKLFLLDHHINAIECTKIFPWYFLDNSRSATKITYDFFSSIYGENESLSKFADVVNSVDIWLDDRAEFEVAKVCLSMVATAKELNKVMFEDESFEYVMHLLQRCRAFFDLNNPHIALDMALHGIKKEFFTQEDDDTLGNLISSLVVNLLSKNSDKFEIKYREFRGILTYNIGNTSVIGNDFLRKNPDFDFFVDVTSKKTVSFRANGKCNVSKMASELVGGGGHVNASGGIYTAFKDSYSYENIKSQIVELINKKTQERENV